MRLRLITIFMIVFLGLNGLWYLALKVLPRPVESNWIAGLYKVKEAAAAKIHGSKLVLVGGSGSHFSYSARLIGEMTGFSVVNLATHAGLGGEYILHRARASLKSGDVAILALEQQLLYPVKPSTVLATFVLTNDPGYIFAAPLGSIPWLLFGYSPVQVFRQAAATSMPATSPLYRVETVTAKGDESVNTPANKLPYMFETVHSLAPISIPPLDPDKPPRYLAEFVEWAKQNNVRVLQAWPATTYRPVYETPAYEKYFSEWEETYRRLGIELLGNSIGALVPEKEMLDSLYHADSVGAERVSKNLAISLCRVMSCSGALKTGTSAR